MINYESIGFSVFVLIVKLKLQPQQRETYFKWAGHFTSLEVDKRAFLTTSASIYKKKFDIGKETGSKEDPAQAFFSRISAKRKQSSSKESSRDNDDELDDSDAEEYACQIDDRLFEANSEAVVAAIAVKHPLMCS